MTPTERRKLVLKLHARGGMTQKEIAAEADCTIQNVQNIIKRYGSGKAPPRKRQSKPKPKPPAPVLTCAVCGESIEPPVYCLDCLGEKGKHAYLLWHYVYHLMGKPITWDQMADKLGLPSGLATAQLAEAYAEVVRSPTP